MNSIAMQGSIAQLRALAASAQGVGSASAPSATGAAFGEILQNTLASVNAEQTSAAAQATAYLKGDPDVSLAQVMISAEKASLSFEAVSQTRNKLLSAYRDIMNMPL
jgi:flagellar hook-basal body complex protein FliE